MKTRIASLLCLSLYLAVSAAFGQYSYDYTMNTSSPGANWNSNGVVTISSGVDSFNWGSLMLIPGVPTVNSLDQPVAGTSSSDYEINTTLSIKSGATGTYVQFLRASSDTVQPGTGNYIAVKLALPTGFTAPGAATLVVSSLIGGTQTTIGSTSVWATDGMTLRSVVFGTDLWIFVNNAIALGAYVPSMTGNPGIGGIGMASNSGFTNVLVGHHDILGPNMIPVSSVASSVFPTSVSLRWAGIADDTYGIGVWIYWLYRNGVAIAPLLEPEYVDTTVSPGTTYTYTIFAQDFHGNSGAGTNLSVTTPPANSIDPHRTGIYTTGSYWGGGGEQIDTLSGNLNFSLPLLTAQGRPGWTVPVNLVYNSQNWRNDNGVNWNLGYDVGYGYGWQAMIGSITPYYPSMWSAVDHYVYTDSTGAQYPLNVNNSGVWSSTQSVYVWLDTTVTPNKLHFRDGSFWVMGCTSGGTEADAGTMYPTVVEDVSGNQITVAYKVGAQLPPTATNTSARISTIVDSRGNGTASYSFTFNSDTPVPHLSGTTDNIGTGASYFFFYAGGVALGPPFGTDPSYAGLTTTHLIGMQLPTTAQWQFTYDTAGAGELLQATFPWGGHLRWMYGTDPYSGSRDLRAVSARFLAVGATGGTEFNYGISRDNAAGAVVHGTMTLSDASGVGAKTWNFLNTSSYPAWKIGLASEFVQSAGAGGTVLQDDLYTWSQDSAGDPYISTRASTIGQGTPNLQTATSTQTLDQYGNVTQSVVYPYNNTTTPLRTFTNAYLTSPTYTSNYIFNRLVSSSVTPAGGSAITLVTNTYDGGANCTSAVNTVPPTQCAGTVTPVTSPAHEMDAAPPIPVSQRGYLTYSVTPTKSTTLAVYVYGSPAMVWGSDGTVSSASADTSTDFNAPVTITSQSYATTLAYNTWLGVTQSTGANGEQMSMTYDTSGRPASATSPYAGLGGPTESYSYSTSIPFTQTKTGPDGVTTTTLDGLGRPVLVARGDVSGVHAYVATTYAPVAGSPLAKVQKTSQPYAYGSSASAWTTYTYDGLGRPLTVQQPDGASTTTYSYSGNVTTVTDAAGKGKQFTTDASGNLVTVTEPDPANPPSGTLTTTYAYDWMNHVTGVSMTRAGTTQTRSFVYDNAGRLTSATNPEDGTVSYVYSGDNTLHYKTDAKGQQTVYSYDSLKRLIMTQYFPNGQSYSEDGCQRVTYSYDTNPYNATFSQNSYGRLTAALYGSTAGSIYFPGAFCVQEPGTGVVTYFAEMYSYHAAGGVTAKQLLVTRGNNWSINPANLSGGTQVDIDVDYAYDPAGRTTTTTYPMTYLGGSPTAVTLTYGYDSMGRPSALTDLSGATGSALGWPSGTPVNWAQNVQYDYAGRMASMQYFTGFNYYAPLTYPWIQTWSQESMGYNVNGQLSSFGVVNNPLGIYGTYWGPSQGVQYNYSATQNNGQITQAVDTISGETISYQYDALKRLTSASSTPNAGSSPAAYTQTFQYDGFGNLTGKVLNGTSTTIAVNAANNQLSGPSYDFNGNMTVGAGATMAYDEANRISWATESSGGTEYYGYTADNKRFYKYAGSSGAEQVTFYGARGEKLGLYTIGSSPVLSIQPVSTNIWFAGKLILEGNQTPLQDRLGTNRVGGARFYPYGDEITSTANDHEKFATYTRDSYTGFDYADQRYYASTYGRFNTADPSTSSAGPSDPVSWNRYSYTGGDPINRLDPGGTDWCDANSGNCFLGSAPGAPPSCGGIYQNAMFAFGDDYDYDLLESPDAATYWAQLQATGCTQYYAQIIPVQTSAPAPPPPPAPGCSFDGFISNPPTLMINVQPGQPSASYYGITSELAFFAAGGDGTYTWTISQAVSATVTETSRASTITKTQTQTEKLPNVADNPSGPRAVFSDAPGFGVAAKGSFTVSGTWNFVDTVTVSSQNQTKTCDVVAWTANETVVRSGKTVKVTGGSRLVTGQ